MFRLAQRTLTHNAQPVDLKYFLAIYIMHQPAEKFSVAIARILRRYHSLFMGKLILQDEEPDVGGGFIRHYDKQCEAVGIIAGTLNTKIKAAKLRCFHLIKFYDKARVTRIKPNSRSQKFIYNNSYNSLTTRAYQSKSIRDLPYFPGTSRRVPRSSPFDAACDIFNEIDVSISALVGKMDQLNRKIVSQVDEDPEDLEFTKKLEKRKHIMEKISELGNDLSSLALDEISDRNITLDARRASQVQLRSYKTSRQLHRPLQHPKNSRF